jgi:hypothetical protein
MAVLVTGASGLLGRAITNSLLADGVDVRAVGRDRPALDALYKGRVAASQWEPGAEDFPKATLQGVTAVFHLMGEPVGGRWTKSKKARIVTSRVTSAQKLARAIGGAPVRLISASSFGIYPGQRGEVYTEETRLDAPRKTFIQSTLRAWENAALSATEGETKVTVIRFGMVAGPEAYPKKLVRLFRRIGGAIVGDGGQIVPIVDIEDAVRMMRWAAEGHAGEGAINCASPNLPRFQEVAEAIAARLGKPVKLRIPDWLARPVLGGSADYFLLSYDVRPAKALARGFTFMHDQPKAILARALAPYGGA